MNCKHEEMYFTKSLNKGKLYFRAVCKSCGQYTVYAESKELAREFLMTNDPDITFRKEENE